LELQISNNDTMGPDMETNFHNPAIRSFHPTDGPVEFARAKAMGEVAYGRLKKEQALAWIFSHKRRFAELSLERIALFWIPNMKRRVQYLLEIVVTVLGLWGLAIGLKENRPAAWVGLGVVVFFPIVYYFIQSSVRYRYPADPILFLFAGSLVARLTVRRSYASIA
jgi:hypothetical protein